MRIGYGGQAASMRDEPNAIGVATKRAPHSGDGAHFSDNDHDRQVTLMHTDLHPPLPVWAALDVGAGHFTPPKALPKGRTHADMIAEFETGIDVFKACWAAPIERVAIESPEMNDLARARMPADLAPPQMTQPHWFGAPTFKATGWYLRGLPLLLPTNKLTVPHRNSDEHRAWSRVHRMSPGPERSRLRSRSCVPMMEAAADQWGGYAMRVVA